jgi:hypothetical protein
MHAHCYLLMKKVLLLKPLLGLDMENIDKRF